MRAASYNPRVIGEILFNLYDKHDDDFISSIPRSRFSLIYLAAVHARPTSECYNNQWRRQYEKKKARVLADDACRLTCTRGHRHARTTWITKPLYDGARALSRVASCNRIAVLGRALTSTVTHGESVAVTFRDLHEAEMARRAYRAASIAPPFDYP